MIMLANILIGVIALLHIYFLVLEMFLWDKPKGLKTFGNSLEDAMVTKKLAMNMGLYNGFLAAGLIWGLTLGDTGISVKVFFLICVLVAGVFGAFTASKKILFVQALPATLALIALMFA
jgi:putative membrane protein